MSMGFALALAALLFFTLSGDSLSGQIPVLQAAGPPAGIVSDEFNGAALDPVWTFVDPVGDSSFTMTGSQIAMSVPAGSDHDVWRSGIDAARIMQSSSDADFEVEAKFDSAVVSRYQLQGILVQADPQNVIRFGTYSSGGGRQKLFAAHINAGADSASIFTNQTFNYSAPIYLKVNRTGDDWIYSYSIDGTNWAVAATFIRSFTVSSVGVYSGNLGGPAHTAIVEYFRFLGPIPPGSLTVQTVGSGNVTKSPDQASYQIDDIVQLTAVPDAGFVFGAWSGDLTGTQNPANITITGDMNVTATFVDDPNTHTVSLASAGSGSTSKSPDQALYSTGDAVQITATPAAGSVFDSWSGDLVGSQNPADLTVTGNMNVTATFVDDPSTHTVSVASAGSGSVSKSPDQALYSTSALVQLTATPDAGWIFDSWSGDLTGNTNPVDVVVLTDTSITANFTPDPNVRTVTVTTTGSGSVSKAPDQALYSTGDVVQLTATADAGWVFDSWSGDLTGSQNPADLTVTGDMSVTAVFVDDPNTHTVNVLVAGSGGVSKSPDQALYSTGDVVQLTATPTTGWTFDSWSGDLVGVQNPVNVTVTTDTNITASFSSLTFTGDEFNTPALEPGWSFVNPVGDGSYAMTGTQVAITVPGGVNHDVWRSGIDAARIMRDTADADFTAEVKFDSDVTQRHQLQGILVQEDSDTVLRFGIYSTGNNRKSVFAAYVNTATGSTTIYKNQRITIAAPIYLKVERSGDSWTYSYSADGLSWNVAATFSRAFTVNEIGVYSGNVGNPSHTAIVDYFRILAPGSVTVQTVGSGNVTKSPDLPSYELGAVVQLTATPDAGSVFSVWSGDLTGSQNSANITVTGAMNVTATFVDDPNANSVVVSTSGPGSVTKSPDQSTYPLGAVVQLAATPDAGSVFSNWSGDLTGSQNPANLTVTGPTSVTATFVDDPNTHTVTVLTSGMGSVAKSPDEAFYSTGSVVQLTATPNTGWDFVSWSGDLTGNANPVNITVTDDLNIIAVFENNSPNDTVFDLFYGDNQQFNNVGRPQVWVNVLGNVSDPEGISSLSFSLNGGSAVAMSMGQDGRRLDRPGDFNVEIPFDDLTLGNNEIVITAIDGNGSPAQKTVLVNYPGRNIWPTTYSVDWSAVTDIQDAVQVIDGEWTHDANGINNIGDSGYDRLFGVGDLDWTNYQIEFPVTVHGVQNNLQSGGLAMVLRWRGHTNSPQCSKNGGILGQPHCGWKPFGYGVWYSWDENGGVSNQFDGDFSLADTSGTVLQDEVTYIFKFQVENLPDGSSIARKKVWDATQAEPANWLIEGNNPRYNLADGSFLFIAHEIDVTVGNITVTPIAP